MVSSEQGNNIRVAILLGAPLTKQNHERIGIPYLVRYFDVMVYDCTPWIRRSCSIEDDDVSCRCPVMSIRNEDELVDSINLWRPHYAIDFLGFGAYTLSIVRVLAWYDVKLIVQKTGALPSPGILLRVRGWVLNIWCKRTWSVVPDESPKIMFTPPSSEKAGLFAKVVEKVLHRMHQIRILQEMRSFPDYIGLIAGEKSNDRFTARSKPLIWIGSNDYHTFNKVKAGYDLRIASGTVGSFILFIDDCLFGAHDWALLSIPPPVTELEYFPALQAFFEKIELEYGIPVVIAGHPNSENDDSYMTRMGGRGVVYGKTAALAIAASLVIIHGSTATSFAVLARKPLISLTSMQLDRSSYGRHIRAMSFALGSRLIFIDKPNSWSKGVLRAVVNEQKYHAYESGYLRSEHSNETEPWGALIEFINSGS